MYAVVHDPSTIRDVGQVKYIRTGQAKTSLVPVPGSPSLTDGDHLPNERWSELSAIYSIWKDGPVTDVVGFCHYRRFFNFSAAAEDERQQTIEESMIDRVKGDFTCPGLISSIDKGLIVVAKPIDLGMPVFDNYSRYHNTNDYLTMFAIVADSVPWLLPFLAEDFSSSHMYANNMFLMNWERFDTICSAWFSVLMEFCERVGADRAGKYQNRDVSFLSERLFNALIKYAGSQGIEVRQQPVYFIEFPRSADYPETSVVTGLGHEPSITVGARLRAAIEALEAEQAQARRLLERLQVEEAKAQQLIGALEAEQMRTRFLLEEIQAEGVKTRQLEEVLASMRASDAWRLSQWLKRSELVRASYRKALDIQRRLRHQ